MSKKAKLSQLNKELSTSPKKSAKSFNTNKEVATSAKKQGPNPVRGERGDFLKVTITLSPKMLADLKRIGIDRKLKGMKDTDVSSLIREAVTNLLEREGASE